MGEHTALSWNLVVRNHVAHHVHQFHDLCHVVGRGVDADDGVPTAVEQTIQQAGGDTGGVVGGMVRLQARRQAAVQADGVAKRRHHPALLGHQNQVLVAHELAHRSRHFRRNAGCQCRKSISVCRITEQPVAEVPHREVAHRRKRLCAMAVQNQAGDLVRLIGHQGLGQKGA